MRYIATALDDQGKELRYRAISMIDALDWALAHIHYHQPCIRREGSQYDIWKPDHRQLARLRSQQHRPYRRASV